MSYDPSKASEEDRRDRFLWKQGDFDVLDQSQVLELLGRQPQEGGAQSDSGTAGEGGGGGQEPPVPNPPSKDQGAGGY
jgi:hypothetical protein